MIRAEQLRLVPFLGRPVRVLRQCFFLELVALVAIIVVGLEGVDEDSEAFNFLLILKWISATKGCDEVRCLLVAHRAEILPWYNPFL